MGREPGVRARAQPGICAGPSPGYVPGPSPGYHPIPPVTVEEIPGSASDRSPRNEPDPLRLNLEIINRDRLLAIPATPQARYLEIVGPIRLPAIDEVLDLATFAGYYEWHAVSDPVSDTY
ncbi:hypothetical protein R1sor_014671 [Riccia sorocarpa]|uniref:Uncharacterized protein n=1 Tax=Riccia sorocarpa TaxID=122646 RepID=A0ABD3HD19_9MARC